MAGALEMGRGAFEIPDDVTYLDASNVAPIPRVVRLAGEIGVARKAAPWTIARLDFFAGPDAARARFAELIGAAPADIAVVPAASFGMATAARNLPLKAGQRVLTLAAQHPSNVYAWRDKARKAGAEHVIVPWQEDGDWTRALTSAIDERTGIVAAPNVHWVDGSVVDLEAVGLRCRAVGAALAVDGTQSVGARPLDVRRVQPDFLVAPTYKWLLGPYSMGFLYVAPKWQGGEPLDGSPYTREPLDNRARWSGREFVYQEGFRPGAVRFDVGETANFALMPMALACLNLIQDWQPARIGATIQPLVERMAAGAAALGFAVPPAAVRSQHIIGVRFPGAVPDGLEAKLASARVYASVRGGGVRVSPHVYNSIQDIDRLLNVLEAAR